MKPSFFYSTLSIAFIICIIAVIAMIFLWVEPNNVTFLVITSVISAYLTNYWTHPKKEEKKEEKQNIHDVNDIQDAW